MRFTLEDYLRASCWKNLLFVISIFADLHPSPDAFCRKFSRVNFLYSFLCIYTQMCVCLKLNKFFTFSILFHFAFEANWELSSLIWNLLWITALDVLSKINIVYLLGISARSCYAVIYSSSTWAHCNWLGYSSNLYLYH